MINPTEKDIGRSVIYIPSHGNREYGIITSFNSRFVFVRYSHQHQTQNGQATMREDLHWQRDEESDE
jgi:hypothetical protein